MATHTAYPSSSHFYTHPPLRSRGKWLEEGCGPCPIMCCYNQLSLHNFTTQFSSTLLVIIPHSTLGGGYICIAYSVGGGHSVDRAHTTQNRAFVLARKLVLGRPVPMTIKDSATSPLFVEVQHHSI